MDNKYKNIMGVLENIQKELDTKIQDILKENNSKTGARLNIESLEEVLENMDLQFNDNLIKEALIEGNEDVRNKIEEHRKYAKQALETLKISMKDFKTTDKNGQPKVQKADKKRKLIDELIKNGVTNSDFSKKLKELDAFQKSQLKTKGIDERANDAKKEYEDLTQRVKVVKACEKAQKDSPNLKFDEKSINDEKNDIYKKLQDFSNNMSTYRTYCKDKKEDDLKKYIATIQNIADKVSQGQPTTEEDFKAVKANYEILQKLQKITKNKDLDEFVANTANWFEMDKNNKNKIVGLKKGYTSEDLLDSKFDNIDFETFLEEAKKNTNPMEQLDTLEGYLKDKAIFAINPELKEKCSKDIKEVKLAQKNGIVIADGKALDVYNAMYNYIVKNPEQLRNRIKNVTKDIGNVTNLENDKNKAQLAFEHLDKEKNRQYTTLMHVKEQAIQVKDENGKEIDFSKVQDDQREDVINKALKEIDFEKDEIKSMVKYEKPGRLNRFLYFIKTLGRGGKLEDVRRAQAEEKVRNTIKDEIKQKLDIIRNGGQDTPGKAWDLTPEEEKRIRLEEYERVKDAKKEGIKAILNDGKTAKQATKLANKELKDKQRDADINRY